MPSTRDTWRVLPRKESPLSATAQAEYGNKYRRTAAELLRDRKGLSQSVADAVAQALGTGEVVELQFYNAKLCLLAANRLAETDMTGEIMYQTLDEP